MQLLEKTLDGLAENVALDEVLLLNAEAGGPEVLRLWEWPRLAVVLGAGGRLRDEVNEDACRADGVPIVRRSSGGGAVLLGAGCLAYSLVLSFDREPAFGDLHASYRFILGRLRDGLEIAKVSVSGVSDLAVDGRKFSGNSQQRKRTHFLHHGTLLYAFDVRPLERYLKQPTRQPAYRQQRSHAEFLTNVPIAVDKLRPMIATIWNATEPMVDWPMDLTQKLVREKYETDEWTRRR